MSIRSRILAFAVVLCVAAFLPGCYTILTHPRLAQLEYRRPDNPRCLSCHDADDLWRFTHPPALPRMTGAWREFYEVPWWQERRWAATSPDSGGVTP